MPYFFSLKMAAPAIRRGTPSHVPRCPKMIFDSSAETGGQSDK
jgi:hypothetical protein